MTVPLLQVTDLRVHFPSDRGLLRDSRLVRAVDGVSFSVASGEVVGLVGESGSGKTTLGRAVLRLTEPTAGSVRFRGQELIGPPHGAMTALRRHVQVVFQDPFASLNPRLTAGDAIAEALHLHRVGTPARRPRRVALRGEPQSPSAPPSGCVFRTRCLEAIPRCAAATPAMEALTAKHSVACVRSRELLPACGKGGL